jgi:hypothetical protein
MFPTIPEQATLRNSMLYGPETSIDLDIVLDLYTFPANPIEAEVDSDAAINIDDYIFFPWKPCRIFLVFVGARLLGVIRNHKIVQFSKKIDFTPIVSGPGYAIFECYVIGQTVSLLDVYVHYGNDLTNTQFIERLQFLRVHYGSIVCLEHRGPEPNEIYLLKQKTATTYTRVDYKSVVNLTCVTLLKYDSINYYYEHSGRLEQIPKKRMKLSSVDLRGDTQGRITTLFKPIRVKLSLGKSIKIMRTYAQ